MFQQIKNTYKKVKKPQYVALFIVSVLLLFLLLSLLPHTAEIRNIAQLDSTFGGGGSIQNTFFISLLAHSATNTFVVTALVSVLSAVNIVLLVLYYKERGAMLMRTSSKGLFGIALGALGIGCSACGTLALTAVLGTLGLGWIVTFLPFHGMEVYVLGVLLLLFSIYQLIKLINKPLTC